MTSAWRAAGALLVLVAGCNGGDDGPRIPAPQFAAETCDDLTPWGQAVDDAFAAASFESARQATRELRSRVAGRAAPAVDNGGDVKDDLLDAIDAFDEALASGNDAEIAGALDNLDPTGGNPELRAAFSQAGACDDAMASLP